MKRYRRNAFTMIELMAVISIIAVLMGLLMVGMSKAKDMAKKKSSEALLNTIATACEAYWTLYHDYPYPEPSATGFDTPAFRAAYYTTEWTESARNIVLIWMLSKPRHPSALVSLNLKWFKRIPEDIKGPDGRDLYVAKDGFGTPIRVIRPQRYYYADTDMKFTSAGVDCDFGEGLDEETKDNVEVYLKR